MNTEDNLRKEIEYHQKILSKMDYSDNWIEIGTLLEQTKAKLEGYKQAKAETLKKVLEIINEYINENWACCGCGMCKDEEDALKELTQKLKNLEMTK